MRCSICDFNDGEAKSLYHTSLVEPKGARNRRVYIDKTTGDPICTVCMEFTLKRKTYDQ